MFTDLPVFLAGVSVKMRNDLAAVLSSHSTLHLDIEIERQFVGTPAYVYARVGNRGTAAAAGATAKAFSGP